MQNELILFSPNNIYRCLVAPFVSPVHILTVAVIDFGLTQCHCLCAPENADVLAYQAIDFQVIITNGKHMQIWH